MLYSHRPTWLELAHKKLNEAVFAAHKWKSDLTDGEILEKLKNDNPKQVNKVTLNL